MADEQTDKPVTPDSGEIEWAGTVSKKPPHAPGRESATEVPEEEEADIDAAEDVGDHRYPG